MPHDFFTVLLALFVLAIPAPLAAQDALFEEVTETCGLAGAGGGKFSFGDFDRDGDPDLLVDARTLYRNDSAPGEIRFTDITKDAGLSGAGGGGACWIDVDRDGYPDFITNAGQVWMNGEGSGFTRMSEKGEPKFPKGTASAIGCGDVNGDGWPDVISGGGEIWKPFELFPQTLWINRKGKSFDDATKKAGLGAARYGRAVVFCDYDEDGDQDVYSGNYRLQPNALFRNDKGKLRDVAEEAGVTGRYDQDMFTNPVTGKRTGYRYGHTIAAAWGDLNNDGYFDLWVSNLAHKAIGKVSEEFAKLIGTDFDTRGYDCDDSNLFINLGPPDFRFEDRRAAMGIPVVPVQEYGKWRGDELWSNAALGDFDNNGWLDAYVNQVYGNQPNSHALLFANEAGTFTEIHRSQGIKLWGGYGAAWADLDSDGDLDLVSCGAPEVNGKSGIHLFANKGAGRDWIGFMLEGDKKVPATGARVELVLQAGVRVRQVETAMGSHTQQNDPRIHFGLGAAARIEEALVRWPDGSIQSLSVPDTGRYHEVKRRITAGPRLSKLTPVKAKAGEETEFRVGLSGSHQGLEFVWDFEGSKEPEIKTPLATATHTYEHPGTYRVTVRAYNAKGGVSERRYEVVVKK